MGLALACAAAVALPLGGLPITAERAVAAEVADPVTPPRTIITTDPELDDLNSLLRMFLYSNEIDIRGLVYSSSQHHYEGDPANGVEPFRWPDPTDVFHIDEAVNRYEEVYPNLSTHAEGFPTPTELRDMITWGNVKTKGDMAEETEGSEAIVEAILSDEPGQLFLQAWGGPNTIARALLSIQEDYEGEPGWEALKQEISDRVVLTSYGQQDDTFDDYIRPNWPEIEHREVATGIWGYFARRSALPEWQKYLSPEWTRANVSDVGPIGESYRVWGDGKQMAAGFDDEDYFGLSGYTREELTAMGYGVWASPEPKDAWISEGDSSNFALLVDNGLRNWQDPSWGGWGGRQAINPDDPYQWRNDDVSDIGPDGQPRDDFAAGRWFEDFQLDFAARMQWTVTPAFADANHEPVVTIDSGLDLTAAPGEALVLEGAATDRDGDALTARWWQYREAGTYEAEVSVDEAAELETGFTVPFDAPVGSTIHLILEVHDDGDIPLTSWQRVVITVAEDGAPRLVEAPAAAASTAGSTVVTLTGSGLAGVNSVAVGGAAATDVTTASDGRSITFTAPPRENAGVAAVVLSGPGGTAEGALQYAAPTADGAQPSRGPVDGGTTVTLLGGDLGLATGVEIDGEEATAVEAIDGGVVFTTPAGRVGPADIVVELPGADVTIEDGFTYADVTVEVSARSVVAGGSLDVRATGFAPGERVEVQLNSTPVQLAQATADADGIVALRVTVPVTVEPGNHTLSVRGEFSGTASAPLTVRAATEPAAAGGTPSRGASSMPDTGAEVGSLAAFAALTMLLGGVLVAARRLRKA